MSVIAELWLYVYYYVVLGNGVLHQDLGHYFSMLNGPTYESLVKHFWVRASIYDKHVSKLE